MWWCNVSQTVIHASLKQVSLFKAVTQVGPEPGPSSKAVLRAIGIAAEVDRLFNFSFLKGCGYPFGDIRLLGSCKRNMEQVSLTKLL